MGSEFLVYLRLGFEHLTDLKGYDHLLFIAALCAVYQWRAWRHLLWLVTAFTVGHTLTLALATLRLITLDDTLVEVLIPVTIFVTSLLNIALPPGATRTFSERRPYAERYKYALALGFGLVHGLGFSNFLRAVLGGEESIVLPLFAFNVGLELAQLMVLFIVLFFSTGMVRYARMPARDWALVLSGATAGIALSMILSRLPN